MSSVGDLAETLINKLLRDLSSETFYVPSTNQLTSLLHKLTYAVTLTFGLEMIQMNSQIHIF